jgi:energy-coupling factor transporter ATP-binding protein EcfA2
MPEPAHFTHLELTNFTVFRQAAFDFVDQVNVFVGENGSGKTHLMKVMYSIFVLPMRGIPIMFNLMRAFQSSEPNNFISQSASLREARVKIEFGKEKINVRFTEETVFDDGNVVYFGPRPVFIPSLDMIGHTRGFVATYDEYNIDFDLTHRDIVSLLLSPEKRNLNGQFAELLEMLRAKTGGEVEKENERFYLKTPHGRQPMPMVAEGLRKLATLSQLIRNGWFQPGTSLFWDEPETNLNPSLMDEVVGAILELSRHGVQVFVATHSYLLLKELEIQRKKSDSLRYFALERLENETRVHPADSYLDIAPNLIEEQYLSVYDRTLDKRLTENGRAAK